jgi:hypothetical protein
MTANVDAMVRAGVEAFRNGSKHEARALLERAIELDTYNEMAWLWLSGVVDTPEEQRTCLENVVVINPKNERARQGLQSLGIDPDSLISPGGGRSTGAATAYNPPAAVRTDDFDNWVEGIGIEPEPAATPARPASPPPPPLSQNLFGDADFSADASFKFDDDILYGEDEYADDEYADDYVEDEYQSTSGGFDSGDDFYADRNTYDDFNDAVSSRMMDDEDDSEFAAAPAAQKRTVSDEPSSESVSNPFAMIPKEIKPTRLPGADEPAPTMAYAVIGVLSVLNVLALVFLVVRLM